MVQLLDLNSGSDTNRNMSFLCLPGWWEIHGQPPMLVWAGAREPSLHSGLSACILRQAEWGGLSAVNGHEQSPSAALVRVGRKI